MYVFLVFFFLAFFFWIFDLPVCCCLFLSRMKESVRSWGDGEVQRSGGGDDLEGAAVRDCGQNILSQKFQLYKGDNGGTHLQFQSRRAGTGRIPSAGQTTSPKQKSPGPRERHSLHTQRD